MSHVRWDESLLSGEFYPDFPSSFCLLALSPSPSHDTPAQGGRFRCVTQVNLSFCRRQSNSGQLSPSKTSVFLSITEAGELDVDFRDLLSAPGTLP